MPNIPGIRFNQSSPGAVNQPEATGATFGGTVNANLAQLGNTITELADHFKDQYDESVSAKATASAQNELQEYSSSLANGSVGENGEIVPPPPPDKHNELYQQKVQSINERFENELGGRSLRMFNSKFGEFASRQGFEVQKNALSRYKEEINANEMEALQRDAVTYANSGSDTERLSIQSGVFERIERRRVAGLITAEAALKERQAWVEDTQMSDFSKVLRSDPTSALVAVQNGEFSQLALPTQRKMEEKALAEIERQDRLLNSANERKRIDEAREEKMRQEGTAKDLWQDHFAGKLTPAAVNDQAWNLSNDDYVRLMKVATGGEETPTDKFVYMDLRLREGRGEDIRSNAMAAYKAGKIQKSDFDKIMSGVEMNSAGPTGENLYKRGKTYISTTVMGSNPELATPADKTRAARTLDDWQSWVMAHPKATRDQAKKEWTTLADEAKIVSIDEMEISVGLPRYYKGDSSTKSRESFLKVAKETKEAFERGEIDQYEFNRQGLIIQRWLGFYPEEVKQETGVVK